ncbi:MAG: DUF418 domain-containing protein [Caldithrix sp.]|nr:DUF418 domain-containing protein [Caldithrix sp.]
MDKQQQTLSPTAPGERIRSMDILRGFALLGILIMNIQNFAMIEAAYMNPLAYGDLTGLNKGVWIFSHIFGDLKFMTLFSIMFGAGILMMSERATQRGQSAAGLHYRRTFWLLIIGLLHAYLLWRGDILVPYALCAVLVFLFRKRSPKTLFILGLLSISVTSAIYFLSGWSIQFWPPESINQTMMSWQPGADSVAKEIAAYQGGWLDQMENRVPSSLMFQTFVFLIWTSWRVGGLMLIGMALFKWGVLTANRSVPFYRNMTLIGFAIGLPVVIYGIVQNFAAGWSMQYSMFLGVQFNYWGSLFISMGFMGGIMLICKTANPSRMTDALAAVGRTALSNYLLQTLICTTIFYGHGLGLFGRVDRVGQILLVLAIWAVQLIVSPIWLKHFRYGPAEWLWRSLTYKSLQPWRVKMPVAESP